MKTISSLLLLVITFSALAQDRSAAYREYGAAVNNNPVALERDVWNSIPKGTKILTVETDLSKDDNFKKAIDYLLDNNFEIDKYDETLGTITTAPKPLSRTGVFYLNIRAKNKELVFSGLFNTNVSIEFWGVRSEAEYWKIEKSGSRNSVFGQAFFQMHQAAESLGKISY